MGFSVSGSAVVLFLGIVISFGIAHAAVNNGVEAVNDAYQDTADKELSQQNTAIEIADAHVANQGGDLQLNVTVNNTGSTTLSVEDTDILINGTYTSHDSMETLEVAGDSETDLWLPGESLYFEDLDVDTAPVRVKVVTESGVSATAKAEEEAV